jgi:(2Fe-2S) ferredoxin
MGSCGGKGSLQLVQYLRARCRESGVRDIQVTTSSCLGCCRAGPMMVVYPDRVWYAYRSEEDVDEILTKHIIGGDVVSRLALLPPPGADAAAS